LVRRGPSFIWTIIPAISITVISRSWSFAGQFLRRCVPSRPRRNSHRTRPDRIRWLARRRLWRALCLPVDSERVPRVRKIVEAARAIQLPRLETCPRRGQGVALQQSAHRDGVAGFHLHFLEQRKQAGGHALDYRLRAGKVQICTVHDLRVELPTSAEFLKTNFEDRALNEKINAAEG
jgi:hypothetical protein